MKMISDQKGIVVSTLFDIANYLRKCKEDTKFGSIEEAQFTLWISAINFAKHVIELQGKEEEDN